MKRLLALLSILFLSQSCAGIGSSFEREPNNKFSEATPIKGGKLMRGYVDSPKDQDFYVYECKTREAVSLSLSALKGINHAISVYKASNSNPLLVKRIDDARKSSPEIFPSLSLSPGKWYFVIGHGDRDKAAGNREQKYSFKITSLHDEDEREPNDAMENAATLVAGTPLTGFFSLSFNKLNKDMKQRFIEYDYFACDVSEGGMMADIELSGVPGVDSVIEVLSSSGRLLLRSDSGGLGAGEHMAGQGIRADGRFFLRIYAKNYGSNYKEPYTLSMQLHGYEEGVELEPNNALEEATFLVETMKGAITPENDIDVFRIDPLADAPFRIVTIMPSSGLDVSFSLVDKNGVQIAEINSGGEGTQEMFSGIRVTESVYAVVKGMIKDETEAQYYHIRAGIANEQNNVELEPNNEPEQALPFNGVINGYLSYKGDKDYYLYESEGRSEVVIVLAHNAADKSSLSVTDNLGYIIRTVASENGNVILNEFVNDKLFIIIESTGQGAEQSYKLTIEQK